MTPEQVFGKLNKDIKGLTSGVASASVSGSSIIFTMNDGSTQTITFPQPKDGASIVAVSTNENNQFVFSMSDGTEIVGGEVPASSGVSKEYVDSELSKKANNSDIPTKVSGLQNDSNYQTDTDVATALTPYAKSADVTKEITNKVAEIIADAPEDFNTLKEMSDWISNHENDASAMNSAISDNKTAITALQTGKADKSEIPTTLPANGGNADTVNNHTVETDVPTDAVFTDTIYDDTEVKGSIEGLSSNLDGLEFGEVAGGKNLFESRYDGYYDDTGVINKTTGYECGDIIPFEGKVIYISTDKVYSSLHSGRGAWAGIACYDSNKKYIPNSFLSIYMENELKKAVSNLADGTKYVGLSNTNGVNVCFSITEIDYVPYIPSVKMLADEKADKSETTVNLLKPTLQTTTQDGVTCTNNGDGTYTLNGTNNTDSTIWFEITDYFTLEPNEKYKLVGAYPNSNRPFEDNNTLWFLELDKNKTESISNTRDFGDGRVFTATETTVDVEIGIRKGATLNNLIFKPMLTTNLSATYDDFVPYTGDGETLASDVAEIKSDLVPKKIELQNVDERVTIKDNGSFIINGFAFVNLLVTFKETLQQWSNFVRLPRPKGGNVTVYCENSVRLTIYSQDNLPGDCGTYDVVQSGTEIRLLVNYEVA